MANISPVRPCLPARSARESSGRGYSTQTGCRCKRESSVGVLRGAAQFLACLVRAASRSEALMVAVGLAVSMQKTEPERHEKKGGTAPS